MTQESMEDRLKRIEREKSRRHNTINPSSRSRNWLRIGFVTAALGFATLMGYMAINSGQQKNNGSNYAEESSREGTYSGTEQVPVSEQPDSNKKISFKIFQGNNRTLGEILDEEQTSRLDELQPMALALIEEVKGKYSDELRSIIDNSDSNELKIQYEGRKLKITKNGEDVSAFVLFKPSQSTNEVKGTWVDASVPYELRYFVSFDANNRDNIGGGLWMSYIRYDEYGYDSIHGDLSGKDYAVQELEKVIKTLKDRAQNLADGIATHPENQFHEPIGEFIQSNKKYEMKEIGDETYFFYNSDKGVRVFKHLETKESYHVLREVVYDTDITVNVTLTATNVLGGKVSKKIPVNLSNAAKPALLHASPMGVVDENGDFEVGADGKPRILDYKITLVEEK